MYATHAFLYNSYASNQAMVILYHTDICSMSNVLGAR